MSEDSDSETEDQFMGGCGSLISRCGLFLWWSSVVNGVFLFQALLVALTPIVFSIVYSFYRPGNMYVPPLKTPPPTT